MILQIGLNVNDPDLFYMETIQVISKSLCNAYVQAVLW